MLADRLRERLRGGNRRAVGVFFIFIKILGRERGSGADYGNAGE
jgi:hypothetical protein